MFTQDSGKGEAFGSKKNIESKEQRMEIDQKEENELVFSTYVLTHAMLCVVPL